MLYWSWFLHFYQPPTQFPQVIKKISQECYQEILKILQSNNNARMTINFSASLTEQLADLRMQAIIDGFKRLAEEGRVELTGSAAYHPLLPKIPKSEMVHQIKLNEKINRKYFGSTFTKASAGQGFFPPEMAYSKEVGEVIEELGYKWIILDESAIKSQKSKVKSQNYNLKLKTKDTSDGVRMHSSEVDGRQIIYVKKNSNLAVFVRNRELSLAIAFSKITNIKQLFQFFDREKYDMNGYVIVALDAETFGHHKPGQLKFLKEILASKMEFVTVSELLDLFPQRVEIEPKTSNWGESWKRWDDPDNPIHRLQWRLYRLALNVGAAEVAQFYEAAGHEFSHPADGALKVRVSALACGTENTPFRSSLGGTPPRAPIIAGLSKIAAQRLLTSRNLLDQALHSDQFWWASHNPCWHLKMVEKGARMLRDVVSLAAKEDKEKKEAQKLYNEIILIGRKLYGNKIIPC